MSNITELRSGIIRIEPNPLKKSSIKIKIQTVSMSGGNPRYITDENGKQKAVSKLKDAKEMSRMPGTLVEYSAAITENGLNTGLDLHVDNPYKEESFYRDGWEHILKDKRKIRLQELLEYKHSKNPGYYTNQLFDVVKSTYTDKNDLPFYLKQESRISLRDGITYLNLNNPVHEINYYMLKAHKMIANSYEELGFNPDATHYIVDLKEKQRAGNKKTRKFNKFAARLEEIFDIEDNTILHMYKALDISSNAVKDDKMQAYDAIDSMVRSDEKVYEDFMSLYETWKNPATRDIFLGYSELFDFLRAPDLIKMKGNEVYWYKPSETGKKDYWSWKSKREFVENFLIAPEYQEEVGVLRSEYRAKTRYEMD
jgi:hypothetical protein